MADDARGTREKHCLQGGSDIARYSFKTTGPIHLNFYLPGAPHHPAASRTPHQGLYSGFIPSLATRPAARTGFGH